MPDVIIIGAGISGLTAAFHLRRAGATVTLLEEAADVGGKIGSTRVDGYLLESGPNSLRTENRETVALIESLGLDGRAVEASPLSKKRYILKEGTWIRVPMNPIEAVTSPLFSFSGKLRVLQEVFVSPGLLDDESIESFITRRLGREVFAYAADPFVTGIYAGDPAKLSMRHAFGAMWNAEKQHGSLIKGMVKAKKAASSQPKVKRRIVSFPDGLSELTSALHSSLADSVVLRQEITSIERGSNGFRVITNTSAHEARSLVITTPAYTAATLLAGTAPSLGPVLDSIDYPPVAVAYLGYRNDQFSQLPEGFGGLIPSSERRKILGVIFSSSNFPSRAPEGHTLLTVLMGGARNRDILSMTEKDILPMAVDEVSSLYSPNGKPVFRRMRLWKRAIPQYTVGYAAILNAISAAERDNPGLHILGNYRGGISIGSCIRNATELAKRLV